MLIDKSLLVFLLFSSVFLNAQEWKPDYPIHSDPQDERGHFGFSIAYDKGTLLVGAPLEKYDTVKGHEFYTAGSAYFFEKQDTLWQQVLRFAPPDLQITEDLGTAVDISGDYAVIGAPYEIVYGINGEDFHSIGVVYVLHHEKGSWRVVQKLTADSSVNVAGGSFGFALDLNGDQLIVGDPGLDYQNGAAYLFHLQDSLWIKDQKISSLASTSSFGISVCIEDNRFAIGAPNEDLYEGYQPKLHAGAVYLFKKEDNWKLEQKIKPSDPVLSDHFGTSVAFSQNILVVGAPDKESLIEYQGQWLNFNGVGIAYSFNKTDTGWVEGPKIKALDETPLAHFGYAMQGDGENLLISAPGTAYYSEIQNKFVSSAGAIYLFTQKEGLISQVAKITAPLAYENGKFGYAVSLSGDTLVAGQISEITVVDDIPRTTYYGSAYVFHKTETIPTSTNIINDQYFSVYPNPAKNICVIGSEKPVSVEIYNSLGRLVKSVNVNHEIQVDISSFQAGLYILVFRDSLPVVKKLLVR